MEPLHTTLLTKFFAWLFDKTIGWLCVKVKGGASGFRPVLSFVQNLNDQGPNFWSIGTQAGGPPFGLAIGEFLVTSQAPHPVCIARTLVRLRGIRNRRHIVREALAFPLGRAASREEDLDLLASGRPIEVVVRFTIVPSPPIHRDLVAKVSIVDNLGHSACVKKAFFRAAPTTDS